MTKLNYPSKPWIDGQSASLIPGLDFRYSQSLRKWIPVTPGAVDANQIEEAFEVRTLQALSKKFDNVIEKQAQLDSDIALSGRIWKTTQKPDNPNANDIWYDDEGKSFSYITATDTWVELNK